MKIKEGYMPFKGHQTYYRVAGECEEGKYPLILLHGGPGSTHNYLEVLEPLAEKTGRQLVMYDQIGCGKSYVSGPKELFCREVWMEELACLIDYLEIGRFHLLGQSWGGMMAIMEACDVRPENAISYIFSSANPASWLWGSEQHRMIRFMPEELQEAIREAEATGDFSGELYKKANDVFMERHCAGNYTEDTPECVTRPKKSGDEAYLEAWGPNEFTPLGNLKDFDYLDKLSTIDRPVLITSGINDLCTPLIAKRMADAIPDCEWVLFEHSRHMPYVEETEKYMKILADWLSRKEAEL